jgi:hypothetical protein
MTSLNWFISSCDRFYTDIRSKWQTYIARQSYLSKNMLPAVSHRAPHRVASHCPLCHVALLVVSHHTTRRVASRCSSCRVALLVVSCCAAYRVASCCSLHCVALPVVSRRAVHRIASRCLLCHVTLPVVSHRAAHRVTSRCPSCRIVVPPPNESCTTFCNSSQIRFAVIPPGQVSTSCSKRERTDTLALSKGLLYPLRNR